ncbi:hypothetical protein DIURU_004011 [Diutina rugosa]|uniref:Actin n=1 Tax=Diutina rugosa TaxID=5481 RepID=A0A642UJ94_DIURU|nr:uncharacterized protein DIURU_004011 [Diutina rugosa]KAA8899970.1 hypothetical protein DIURU_004011 [Diutina rugosa]
MAGLYNQPVVVDNGQSGLRAGIAGGDIPTAYGPSMVGRPKYAKIMVGADDGAAGDGVYVGAQARRQRGLLRLSVPIDHGQVTNWGDMARVWHQCFSQQLKLASISDHPVLITESPQNPRRNRELIAEELFERFGAPGVYVSTPAPLALYASGRTTGVVVDVGEGQSSVVSVYDGFALPNSTKRMDVAGSAVTAQLSSLLHSASGVRLSSSAEMDVVREIKESVASVAPAAGAPELKQRTTANEDTLVYTLPDGHKLRVGSERFQAAEIIFRPDLVGDESPGLAAMVDTAIAKCDLDLRATLWQSIHLSGGSTLTPGFGDRLLSELHHYQTETGTQTKIKLMAPPERLYSVWIGGSILANLSSFRKMYVTKEEYRESPHLIHTRCA